jgi:hypothetical protein
MLSQVLRKRTAASEHSPGQPFPWVEADAIVFVGTTDTPRRILPGMQLYSELASLRLRSLPIALELSASRPLYFWPINMFSRPEAMDALRDVSTLFVTKFATGEVIAQAEHFEALLESLGRLQGKMRLIADLTDNYAAMQEKLRAPFLGRYQEALGAYCTLTVPCEALRSTLRSIARHGIHVIEDPYESESAREPKTSLGDPVRLCWFGSLGSNNLDTVCNGLAQAASGLGGRAARLQLVTHESREGMVAEIGRRLAAMHPMLTSEFVPWSLEATWSAIDDSDLVLIPQEHADAWGSVKSHNRLVETIRGGRLAVASPIPSYLELADFACIAEDLAQGVAWALSHPQQAEQRIRAGQDYVGRRFSPQRILGLWTRLLTQDGEIEEQRRSTDAIPSPTPVRLNLGCGDKILPGYINVDIAATRAGRSPDVVCDLHDLKPFASDTVDEVLAVHVVEHFWRWEVVAILKEWLRVVKPGGRIILECPNLLTACEELLRNPEMAAGPGPEGQRTMWVLYGDPSWRDPLMCHRWNYTPQSLGALMAESGMVNIRQEPAQFKLREPRDMRIVGEKSLR